MKFLIIFFLIMISQTLFAEWYEIGIIPENKTLNDITTVTNSINIAVGNNGVIKRSIDSGYTWNVVRSGIKLDNLNSVNAFNEEFIIAVGDNGTFLNSVDKGTSWVMQKMETDADFKDIAIIENHGIVISDEGVILVSSNSGIAWTKVSTSYIGMKKALFLDSVAFIIGDKGLLLKSIDFGLSWLKINIQTDKDLSDITEFNRVLTVVGYKQILLRSNDYFETWTSIDSQNLPNLFFSVVQISDSVLFAGVTVYSGLQHAISTNQGTNWLVGNYPDAPVHSFSISHNGKYTLSCGNSGQISRNDNLIPYFYPFEKIGKFVEIRKEPYNFIRINGINSKELMAASELKVYSSQDSGMIWQEILKLKNQKVSDICLTLDYFYVLVDSSVFVKEDGQSYFKHLPIIYRSSNRGENWTTIHIEDEIYLKQIQFDGSYGVAYGNFKRYWATTDGGNTWDKIDFPPDINIYDLQIIDINNIIYIGINSNNKQVILKSFDFGLTFEITEIELYDLTSLSHIFFSDNNLGRVLIGNTSFNSNNFIYKTDNGGKTWIKSYEYFSEISSGLVDMSFSDSTHGIIFGQLGKILQTTDGGNSWFKDSIPTNNFVSAELYYPDNNIGFIAANDGLFRYDATSTSNVLDSFKEKKTNDIIIFPNPINFAMELKINIILQNNYKIDLELINNLGIKVSEIYSGGKVAGEHTLQFTPEPKLPSGLYWVRMIINGEEQVVEPVVIIQ